VQQNFLEFPNWSSVCVVQVRWVGTEQVCSCLVRISIAMLSLAHLLDHMYTIADSICDTQQTYFDVPKESCVSVGHDLISIHRVLSVENRRSGDHLL
jgi:hypothetical protein